MYRSPLDPFVSPSAIALFGASPDIHAIGGRLARNLLGGRFAGEVHLINPQHAEIGGHPCHASLADVPGGVDLALIATPAATLPDIIEQCGKKRVKAAIVHSAGFAETGCAGAQAEAELLARARQLGIRLMGPRALGFIRPHLGLNATPFLRNLPPGGNLALVSQSGAVCTGVLDWVFNEDFALSAVFSPGHGRDLNLPEILDFLASDPRTESILLYLEGIPDSRRFMSALRAAARVKPVVVVKSGRTLSGAAVAQAHNLAPAGYDDAFDAALRRAGALRVRSIGDLFSAARALTSAKKPQGNRLAIITNGGGPAVMAADAAADYGIRLPLLSPATVASLQRQLPPSWSLGNPVDILIGAEPQRFAAAIQACLDDPAADGTLVIFSPDGLVDPAAVARALIEISRSTEKPLLACWMGEASVQEARHVLAEAHLPVFRTPESAITAFAFMVDFVRNQRLLLETPPPSSSYRPPDAAGARRIIAAALDEGRDELTPAEAGDVLASFRIPPAARHAPVQSGGRALRLCIRTDPVFGPVITLGESGAPADLREAASLALPPLNDRLIGDLFREPAIARLFVSDAGRPAIAREPLRAVLLRVSELACELPWIDYLEIDPLFVDDDRQLAAGQAAVVLRPASAPTARYAHMAICPYPLAMETQCQTRNGLAYRIRPIRPEDASALQEFVRGLSDRTRFYRFFGAMRELPVQQLVRRTQIDYDREMVLVAVHGDEAGGEKIIAEANYVVLAGEESCEFGVVVADGLAGQGVGSRIMGCLMEAARQRGLRRVVGEVLSDNEPMLAMMTSLGFIVAHTDDPDIMEVSLRF